MIILKHPDFGTVKFTDSDLTVRKKQALNNLIDEYNRVLKELLNLQKKHGKS